MILKDCFDECELSLGTLTPHSIKFKPIIQATQTFKVVFHLNIWPIEETTSLWMIKCGKNQPLEQSKLNLKNNYL